MREKITFHTAWYDAVKALPKKAQGEALMTILGYAIEGVESGSVDGVSAAILAIAKPQIDADNTRYDNGCKGGRPRGKAETERKPNGNRTITERKPKHNRNITENNRTETETKPNCNLGFLGGDYRGGTPNRTTTTTTTSTTNNFNTDDVEVDDLCVRMRAETAWVEAVCMNLHKDPAYIQQRLAEFCTEQKVQGVTTKSLGDAKRHFRSWLRKVEQIEAEQSRRGEPQNSGRPYPLFSYDEMLAEVQRRGGTTNDYAPVKIGGKLKPMWVRLADKMKFNIPDNIAS